MSQTKPQVAAGHKTKYGRDLVVGDILEICRKWGPIERLETYRGSLDGTVFKTGARFAYFPLWRLGMTIPNDGWYDLV